MKIIFLGTPEFAAPSLQKFFENPDFEIAGVFCEPDRPQGRKQILTPPPAKVLAKKLKLKVYQPEKIREEKWIETVKKIKPDMAIVVAFGQIIPKNVLDIPKHGFLNLHPSLLPKYRGPSPIQTAILNGDKETGISIMLLDEKMDHGPVLTQKKIKLKGKETAEILHDKLSKIGADLLAETAKNWKDKKIKAKPQNHKKATFTKILKREDGLLDFTKSAEEIERQIRAYYPWPGTFMMWRGKRLKILFSHPVAIGHWVAKIGDLFSMNGKLAIKCKKDALVLERVQLEGKSVMTGEEFLRGYKI
jgi:methionyl-tRNA formyltransferase